MYALFHTTVQRVDYQPEVLHNGTLRTEWLTMRASTDGIQQRFTQRANTRFVDRSHLPCAAAICFCARSKKRHRC